VCYKAYFILAVVNIIMPVKEIIASRLGVGRNMNMKSKVCRCLFGMPDHEEVRKDLDQELRKISKDMKSTWNFDPDMEQPLPGRYMWTLADDVPEFYTKGYRPTKFTKRTLVDSSVETEAQNSGSDSETETPSVALAVERLSESESEDVKAEVMDLKRENEKTPEAQIVRQTRIPGKT